MVLFLRLIKNNGLIFYGSLKWHYFYDPLKIMVIIKVMALFLWLLKKIMSLSWHGKTSKFQ